MSLKCESVKKPNQNTLPKGWHKISLEQFVTFHRGYDLPHKYMINGQYAVVGSNGIIGYHNAFKAKGPGVAVGRSGNLGKPFFVDKDYWPHNTALYVSKFHNSDPTFVYYFLKTLCLGEYNAGSAVPTLNRNHIHTIEVVVPEDIEEQKTIGKVLANLDAKIELNQQENRVLEVIGEAVFKRWFVDFEFPNQEGKPYKSTGGKMEETSFGEIPSDWQIGGLGDICDIVMGQSPPGETYNEIGKGIPFFQGIRDFGFRFPSKRVYCTAPTRFAEEGDVLLSVRAPVGSLNITDERCAIGRGVAALRLKGKQNSFLYYLLLATRTGWGKYDAKGTVFGSATKQDVYDFKIVIPSKELQDKFGEFMESLDKKILLNERESRDLTAIRDLLLPKLMSGKIRVPLNKENLEAT